MGERYMLPQQPAAAAAAGDDDVGSRRLGLASGLVLAGLALDVGTGAAVLTGGVDAAANAFVDTAVPEAAQRAFDDVVSAAPIWAGGVGCVVALAACRPGVRARTVASFVAAQALVAGPVPAGLGDPVLVALLKHAFARVRPGPRHTTFSFPSGHTTAAAFYAGALALALLPRANLARLPRPLRAALGAAQDRRVWASLVVCTAAGRVLGDCHWVSDVAAGAALGTGTACALAATLDRLEGRP